MIDVILQMLILHHEDDKVRRSFSLHSKLPALPPNLIDTQFKLVPLVATLVRDPVLTWNQVLERYVISGYIKPTTVAGFDLLIAGLQRQGWHEEASNHKDALI